MRPSIMSLGATTSAPARGVRDGGRARAARRVASLSTSPPAPISAAVAVVGVLAQADVGDDEQLGVRVLDRARRELDDALVVVGAGALGVLARRGCRTAARAGRPSACASPASSTAAEMTAASTPGIASIGVAAPRPCLHEQRQHEVGRRAGASRARGRAGPAWSAAGAGGSRERPCDPGYRVALAGACAARERATRLDRGLLLGQAAALGLDVGLRAEVQHGVVGELDARRDLRRVEHRARRSTSWSSCRRSIDEAAGGRRAAGPRASACVMSSVGIAGLGELKDEIPGDRRRSRRAA